MFCSKFAPRTPSLGCIVQHSTVPFSDYADMDVLLSETVVGNYRHKESLFALRACCRCLRNSIDSGIAMWCSKFLTARGGRVSYRQDQDELYSSVVDADMMIEHAFGYSLGPAKALLDVSVVNKTTYLCALVNRCVLCGETMSKSCRVSMEDSEQCTIPNYVFAHRPCIRKNLVMLTEGASSIPRGVEPRELHRELSAVSQMNPRSVVITKETVMSALSQWYKTVYSKECQFGPQLVWLRNHHMVRPEDTLYGSLQITNQDIVQSVMAINSRSKYLALQSESRKKNVISKVVQHKQQCIAELRLWLGKGLTRWRTVEDLEDFQNNILTSIGFLGPTATHFNTRVVCGNVNIVFNTLLLLDMTIDILKDRARYCMDWLVNTVRVDLAFENDTNAFSPMNMLFLSTDMRDTAAAHEVNTIAGIMNSFAACKPEDIMVTRFTKASTSIPNHDLPKYNAHVSIFMREYNVTVTSQILIGHADMCKLKHVLIKLTNPELAQRIPPAPAIPVTDISAAETFFSVLIKLCFSEKSGTALSKGLSVLVDHSAFYEIRDSIQKTEDL